MKKLVVFISFGLGLISLSAFSGNSHEDAIQMTGECKHGQCNKIKDDGLRCRNCCQQNSYYCWSHR